MVIDTIIKTPRFVFWFIVVVEVLTQLRHLLLYLEYQLLMSKIKIFRREKVTDRHISRIIVLVH